MSEEFDVNEWNRLPEEERGRKMDETIKSYMDLLDAPCYGIVKSCEQLGFEKPLDRKWVKLLIPSIAACYCGMQISRPTLYSFTYSEEGNQNKNCTLFITQCDKCQKIYWAENNKNP